MRRVAVKVYFYLPVSAPFILAYLGLVSLAFSEQESITKTYEEAKEGWSTVALVDQPLQKTFVQT